LARFATWRTRSPLGVLLIAACCGLAAGVAEGVMHWVRGVIPNDRGWITDQLPDILWVVPSLYLVAFLAVGVLLLALSLVPPLRRLRSDLVAWGLFGFLAAYAPLAVWDELHPLALLALAAGITVQLCRMLSMRVQPTDATLRRSLLGLAGLTVLLNLAGRAFGPPRPPSTNGPLAALGGTLEGVLSLSSPPPRRGLLGGGGGDAQPSGPNVLMIVLDTLRADHLSSYGYGRATTPNLDRLASAGVLFENAFSSAAWTLPSHATLFTGRAVHEHRAWWGALDGELPTLAEYLSAKGFTTAGFVANTSYLGPRTGLSRGFHSWTDYFTNLGDMVARTSYGRAALRYQTQVGYYDIPGRKRAREVNEELLSWLDARPDGRFFAFLNYLDVHDPYVPPPPFDTLYSTNRDFGTRINHHLYPKPWTVRDTLTPHEIRLELDAYDASLAYLDAQLGELFGQLEARGALDDTLILVTSDHGEAFGDHGVYVHGETLYKDVLHVPLIVRYPSAVPAGRRVACAASLQAIASTVTELAGVGADSPFAVQSLSTHWADHPDGQVCEDALALAENLDRDSVGDKAIMTARWHFIVRTDRDNQLFRMDVDPREERNLSSTDEGRAVKADLASRMDTLMSPKEWKRFARYTEFHR
jgi:arylsulfatase A-like enzyme